MGSLIDSNMNLVTTYTGSNFLQVKSDLNKLDELMKNINFNIYIKYDKESKKYMVSEDFKSLSENGFSSLEESINWAHNKFIEYNPIPESMEGWKWNDSVWESETHNVSVYAYEGIDENIVYQFNGPINKEVLGGFERLISFNKKLLPPGSKNE